MAKDKENQEEVKKSLEEQLQYEKEIGNEAKAFTQSLEKQLDLSKQLNIQMSAQAMGATDVDKSLLKQNSIALCGKL